MYHSIKSSQNFRSYECRKLKTTKTEWTGGEEAFWGKMRGLWWGGRVPDGSAFFSAVLKIHSSVAACCCHLGTISWSSTTSTGLYNPINRRIPAESMLSGLKIYQTLILLTMLSGNCPERSWCTKTRFGTWLTSGRFHLGIGKRDTPRIPLIQPWPVRSLSQRRYWSNEGKSIK